MCYKKIKDTKFIKYMKYSWKYWWKGISEKANRARGRREWKYIKMSLLVFELIEVENLCCCSETYLLLNLFQMRTHCEIICFCTIPELPAVPPDNRTLHSVPQCNGATLDKHQWPLDLSERDKIKEKSENRFVAETIQSSTSITLFNPRWFLWI